MSGIISMGNPMSSCTWFKIKYILLLHKMVFSYAMTSIKTICKSKTRINSDAKIINSIAFTIMASCLLGFRMHIYERKQFMWVAICDYEELEFGVESKSKI